VVEFEGFDGFVNFAQEVDASINSPVWKAVRRRVLKPEAMEQKIAVVEGRISEKPHAKEYLDMVMEPEFLHPNPDAAAENQI
jgi:nitrogenase molybdenum-cofactor synthesis protein NifE